MSLLVLHKVLVACAGLFFFFFGIRELIREGEQNNPVIAILCLALGLGCVIYFMWVMRGGYSWKQKEE
jgi:hypothetical protein